MTTYTFVALTNAVAGREQEFNDWYDRQHVPDVLAVPGFVAARRYEIVGQPVRAAHTYRYLATYEVVTDDPEASMQELIARLGTSSMPITPAIEPDIYAVMYRVR
jgi:hypothetical protein